MIRIAWFIGETADITTQVANFNRDRSNLSVDIDEKEQCDDVKNVLSHDFLPSDFQDNDRASFLLRGDPL